MAGAFASLKIGDPFFFDDAEYVTSGRMRLRAENGEAWTEWLLVPRNARATDALRERRHRWISRENGRGLHLWAPTDPPEGFAPDTLAQGKSLRHLGRDYRVAERYSVEVVETTGDLGGDAARGERFDAADLFAGAKALSIEWDARGTDATIGRHIGDHDLVRWSKEAGGGLASRVRTPAKARTPTVVGHGSGNMLGWGIGGMVMLLIIALQSCDDDRDCRQRYNATTGQHETVCERGLRSSYGSRTHGGWGGK